MSTEGTKKPIEPNGTYQIPSWFVKLNSLTVPLLVALVVAGFDLKGDVGLLQNNMLQLSTAVAKNSDMLLVTREEQLKRTSNVYSIVELRDDLNDLATRVRELERLRILPEASRRIDELGKRLDQLQEKYGK